jgi:uncharacterized protein
MQITEDFGSGRHLINAYGEGYIRINQREYRQNILLTPEQIIEGWCDCQPQLLSTDYFSLLLDQDIELILLGTGPTLIFPPASLMQHFLCQQVGFEVMDSGAACRTYNVLLAEERHVAAAIWV